MFAGFSDLDPTIVTVSEVGDDDELEKEAWFWMVVLSLIFAVCTTIGLMVYYCCIRKEKEEDYAQVATA